MRNKNGFEMSFAWLFSLIVGAFIIFLAIYAVTKIIDQGEVKGNAETAKQLGVILNPLQSSVETNKNFSFSLPSETRIHNKCNPRGEFGNQIVRVSQKSFGDWAETDLEIEYPDKFIFSDHYEEGKDFVLFSRPFNFPFKTTELTYLFSTKNIYCFINSPDFIVEDFSSISLPNILLENCSERTDVTKVCFESESDCDVLVSTKQNIVSKEEKNVYFEGDELMYAAIFSPPEIYECQLERLMKKVSVLSEVYLEKEKIISKVGCTSSLDLELGLLQISGESFSGSENIFAMKELKEKIENKNNNNEMCKLW